MLCKFFLQKFPNFCKGVVENYVLLYYKYDDITDSMKLLQILSELSEITGYTW